jgi:hypothetical protein
MWYPFKDLKKTFVVNLLLWSGPLSDSSVPISSVSRVPHMSLMGSKKSCVSKEEIQIQHNEMGGELVCLL